MTAGNRTDIIDNELLIVRHSGEIPEITLSASLYYLSEDPDGPEIVINEEELRAFQDEALSRSREIILRDLDPDNRDRRLYRGLKRTIANYRRHHDFLERIDRLDEKIKGVTSQALLKFLKREVEDMELGQRASSINCTLTELLDFVDVLGISRDLLPISEIGEGWEKLCVDGKSGG
jgi:hypothetical protein